MKRPEEIAARLARQWYSANHREERLLRGDFWPFEVPVGAPTANAVREHLADVRSHLAAWREVSHGKVIWKSRAYRGLSDTLEIPVTWQLEGPEEWIEATTDPIVKREYTTLVRILGEICPCFHPLLIRDLSFIRSMAENEILKSVEVAMQLSAGCAAGLPMRTISIAGADTKFLERNRALVTGLLDVRFDGVAGQLGLEGFLGASRSGEHWLLVADLDGGLLPWRQLRLRDVELCEREVPGTHLIIVENEGCLHHLPPIKGGVAILGAGLNLAWMAAPWLGTKRIAYWGDIDTWGFLMLSRARALQPGLTPLMMAEDVFNRFQNDNSVPESVKIESINSLNLSDEELRLFDRLLATDRGRLEQEFIPPAYAHDSIQAWYQRVQ